jgi:hypothetical protein
MNALTLARPAPQTPAPQTPAPQTPAPQTPAAQTPAPAAPALPDAAARPDPVGEVAAVWSAGPGALLVLGWQTDPPPAEGVAQLERRRTDCGPFRSSAWRRADGTHAFAAAVRLPAMVETRPGQRLALRAPSGPALIAVLPDAFAESADLAAIAAPLFGEHLAALVRFVLAAFPPDAMASFPALAGLLAALLPRAAEDDGSIELAGAIPGHCTFLQGWGSAADGATEAILIGADGAVRRAPSQAATFRRDDIARPASGLVTVLPPDCAAALPALDAVFLVSPAGVVRRPLHARRVLDASDSAGHLRDMLGVLAAPPALAEALRAALRPRYAGVDTLAADLPSVRAMIDVALSHPSGGLYLSGWLFDPAAQVAAVTLADGAGLAARLDRAWTRVPRADVTAAFAADPAFPPAPHDDHGFVAHVPGAAAEGSLHLIIERADGARGFVPVAARPLLAPGGRQAAVGSVDLHKPSGLAIVEGQLAPFVRAAFAPPRARLPAAVAPRNEPPAEADVSLAIVVPLTGPPVLPRALLSQFLRDPLAPRETLLLLAGPEWDRTARDRLEAQARALGLAAAVIAASSGVDEPADVLRRATGHADAAQVLLLAPAAIGRAPGWRRALLAASRLALRPAAVCPTLLYEDLSVRHAGPARVLPLRTAPYLRIAQDLAGLPAGFANAEAGGDGLPVPIVLGTLHCCLLPRAALPALAPPGPTALSPRGRELGFFLRLRDAGIPCLWAPSVQVFAPETTDLPHGGADAASLADLLNLRDALDGAALRPLET